MTRREISLYIEQTCQMPAALSIEWSAICKRRVGYERVFESTAGSS